MLRLLRNQFPFCSSEVSPESRTGPFSRVILCNTFPEDVFRFQTQNKFHIQTFEISLFLCCKLKCHSLNVPSHGPPYSLCPRDKEVWATAWQGPGGTLWAEELLNLHAGWSNRSCQGQYRTQRESCAFTHQSQRRYGQGFSAKKGEVYLRKRH